MKKLSLTGSFPFLLAGFYCIVRTPSDHNVLVND